MSGIANINAWKKKTDDAKKLIKSKATAYVQARVKKVLNDALKVSPQWSGNYAANWRIEITGYKGGGALGVFKENPWTNLEGWDIGKYPKVGGKRLASYAGALEAIEWNRRINYEIIEQIKWNSNIALVNNAPVAAMLDAGEVKLRRVNLVAAPHGVIAYLKTQYSYLS